MMMICSYCVGYQDIPILDDEDRWHNVRCPHCEGTGKEPEKKGAQHDGSDPWAKADRAIKAATAAIHKRRLP